VPACPLPDRTVRPDHPRPRRRRHIDAGVTGALILYGATHTTSTAGELISHALALLIPLIAGGIAFAFLPREIERQRHPYLRRGRSDVTLATVGLADVVKLGASCKVAASDSGGSGNGMTARDARR
jgi:hypothetical protein